MWKGDLRGGGVKIERTLVNSCTDETCPSVFTFPFVNLVFPTKPFNKFKCTLRLTM